MPASFAEFDPEALAAVFGQPPALHRFPKSMAGRVQESAGRWWSATTAM